MVVVFLSYSHHDEEWRNELERHLSVLKRQGVISVWHDRRIGPGQEVHREISNHLEMADVILLLVSPYFLDSDYCYDREMARAMEKHEAEEAIVIPVIVHPCDWLHAPFGKLRATPKDGKPISKFPNVHDALLDVTNDIRRASEALGKGNTQKRTTDDAKPTAPAEGPRSSNLRIKRDFSDQDRDKFVDETFAYIYKFFENSLEELRQRSLEVSTRFKPLDRASFSAAVYISGQKKTSCRIWQGDRADLLGDIAYSSSDSGPSGSFNESLRVADDGHKLGMKPLGLAFIGSQPDSLLTPHGAAEYFWTIFISRLQ